MEQINNHRHVRALNPGELVFRRMPWKARPAKHLLDEPSRGPYIVVGQGSLSSVKLKDPATGLMVEDGHDIPMDQIQQGPRRSMLQFSVTEEDRSIGQMLLGKDSAGEIPEGVQAAGWIWVYFEKKVIFGGFWQIWGNLS